MVNNDDKTKALDAAMQVESVPTGSLWLLGNKTDRKKYKKEAQSIMKICTCENCKYTFRYPFLPFQCPDCGKKDVRMATEQEKKEYYNEQRILAKEIQLGLYAAAGWR